MSNTEGSNIFHAEYAVLSPVERNYAYRRLWNSLPLPSSHHSEGPIDLSEVPNDLLNVARGVYEELSTRYADVNLETYERMAFDIEKTSQNRQRRDTSELRDISVQRLDALLGFAPITDTFKAKIKSCFERKYRRGVIKNDQGEIAGFLFDPTDYTLRYDSMIGIFDPETAVLIEEHAFNYQLTLNASKNHILSIYHDTPTLEEQNSALERKKLALEELENWENDFETHYGRKPQQPKK